MNLRQPEAKRLLEFNDEALQHGLKQRQHVLAEQAAGRVHHLLALGNPVGLEETCGALARQAEIGARSAQADGTGEHVDKLAQPQPDRAEEQQRARPAHHQPGLTRPDEEAAARDIVRVVRVAEERRDENRLDGKHALKRQPGAFDEFVDGFEGGAAIGGGEEMPARRLAPEIARDFARIGQGRRFPRAERAERGQPRRSARLMVGESGKTGEARGDSRVVVEDHGPSSGQAALGDPRPQCVAEFAHRRGPERSALGQFNREAGDRRSRRPAGRDLDLSGADDEDRR